MKYVRRVQLLYVHFVPVYSILVFEIIAATNCHLITMLFIEAYRVVCLIWGFVALNQINRFAKLLKPDTLYHFNADKKRPMIAQ